MVLAGREDNGVRCSIAVKLFEYLDRGGVAAITCERFHELVARCRSVVQQLEDALFGFRRSDVPSKNAVHLTDIMRAAVDAHMALLDPDSFVA